MTERNVYPYSSMNLTYHELIIKNAFFSQLQHQKQEITSVAGCPETFLTCEVEAADMLCFFSSMLPPLLMTTLVMWLVSILLVCWNMVEDDVVDEV